MERLQKVIAESGLTSRRKAEELIIDGKVKVNGQTVTELGTKVSDADEIKKNLIIQLTAPVKWTQSVQQMIKDGATSFTEVGPGKVLVGLVNKIDKEVETISA